MPDAPPAPASPKPSARSSAKSSKKFAFGPGVLVAAAFIGPGTVTACTLAGARYGFDLLWALGFATLATICLQDMAARLGVGAQRGLGAALMENAGPRGRIVLGALVVAALGLGNSAYEGGNLAGAALGLAALSGADGADGARQSLYVISLALLAGAALLIGRYKLLERVLVVLVIILCCAFIASAALVRPSLAAITAGFVPSLPSGSALTAMALIGTTIVPYNLFLHAATARAKWPSPRDVGTARLDGGIAIGLGGIISMLILATAAATLFKAGLGVTSAGDMARAIEPLAGPLAPIFIGTGLAAAGLTSAITAPMATAYALTEIIGRSGDMRLFRAIALAVVLCGAGLNLLGITPVPLIILAQAANALLLPLVAGLLLMVMNRRDVLGRHANGALGNIAGVSVLVITLALGARTLASLGGFI